MNVSTLIRNAQNDGLILSLSPFGTIKATGEQEVVNLWLPTIREHKTGIIAVLNTSHTSRRWLIHFTDREPACVSCTPEASHDEILARHPGAIAAEPFAPISKPAAPMTGEEEAALRAWLAKIGETDAANIADVLNLCQGDSAAREYFIGQAEAFEERAAVMEFDGGLSRAEAERRAYYG